MSSRNGKLDPNSVLARCGPETLRTSVDASLKLFAVDPAAEPESSPNPLEYTVSGDRVLFTFADRVYEVDGLSKARAPGSLCVTIHAKSGEHLFADKIELYAARDRERFIRACASSFEIDDAIVKSDLSRMHAALRDRQDQLMAAAQAPKAGRIVPPMSESERREAEEFLRAPDLTERIVRHCSDSGIVGEEDNLLTAYIAATSRLLFRPLHVLFQASSAAGKSTVMKAVVSMMPPEAVFGYSALSPKALQYMQDRDLRHSLFVVEEDRGAEFAREFIKLLKTEGRANSATTIKDPETGQMRTFDFEIAGPMSFFMTSTALWIDDEIYNRDLVCTADESREQTARIQTLQRLMQTLEGRTLKARREKYRKLHQNAQRLLRPIAVVNPYAVHMTFENSRHRLRRDHEKYLGIIEAVTLLHQYQRPLQSRTIDGIREEYIEVALEDIAIANRIAVAVLGRSLDDCPPHTRNLLESAAQLADEEADRLSIDRDIVRLRARELSEYTGLSISQVQRHLVKLAELELVVSYSGKHSPFREYEILFRRDQSQKRFLPGILDVAELARRSGARTGEPAGAKSRGTPA